MAAHTTVYFPVRVPGVSFAGVTQEGEDDLRYFVETYQRPLRSVTFLADEQGVLTKGYQVGARCCCFLLYKIFSRSI